jgi:hypothetical protein
MKPAREEDIPKATHEGKTTIFGVEVRTFRLDDGRSVIHVDDFHKLLRAMGLELDATVQASTVSNGQ